jgi:hypothetical protein
VARRAPGDRLDVAVFEELLASGGADRPAACGRPPTCTAATCWRAATTSGCGPTATGCGSGLLDALRELAELCAERGDPAEALRHAERLVRADPLRESAHRLLMRCHDARGDRGRALRAYHECAAVLERELGVEVSAETGRPTGRCCPCRPARAGPPGRAPLVGRVPERTRLVAAWQAAEAGRAQLVVVGASRGWARPGWPRSSGTGACAAAR